MDEKLSLSNIVSPDNYFMLLAEDQIINLHLLISDIDSEEASSPTDTKDCILEYDREDRMFFNINVRDTTCPKISRVFYYSLQI